MRKPNESRSPPVDYFGYSKPLFFRLQACPTKRSLTKMQWRGKKPLENNKTKPNEENSAAKAKRLADKLRFRLKEASAQRGGSEAFLHWLRSDGKKNA